MAHELTLGKNGRYEMAFVGETPWHGLGQSVTKGASIGVWAKEAGMDWEALSGTPNLIGRNPDGRMVSVDFPDYKGLYRSDNRRPLAIVGRDYKPHQPHQLLEFFREFTESGGWHIHTAGTMRGGRKLWVMATTEDARRYVKGNQDLMVLNLLLATSMDGSMQTTGCITPTRVVCANTLRIALEGTQTMVKLGHRSTFDAEHIKRSLGVECAHQSFSQFMDKAREMADTPVALEEASEVLRSIFAAKQPRPEKPKLDLSWLNMGDPNAGAPEEESAPDLSRTVSRVLELFQGEGRGSELKTARGTRWGLLNAVTEFVDHEMGRTQDVRLDNAWFGRGIGFKQDAFKLLTTEEA